MDRGPPVRDRVGFVRIDGDGTRQYLVLPEQFRREVVTGFDVKWSARVLAEHNLLVTQGDRHTCTERIPALGGIKRVYILAPAAAGVQP